MKSAALFLIIVLFAFSGCSETTSALYGGGASINQPREIAPSLYSITCQRGRATECMVAARNACGSNIEIIEQFSRTGFVRGDPAHLIDASFKCKA
ncbi:hypothetical protein [Roseinatronobacter monicus]|uniref:hypothetical protein n=1 Tax=Roseinatronobacter monicus TaxID=393481 RepID=UPI0011513468|nr:hypothetical protein [Roseinatronobacter monicus]